LRYPVEIGLTGDVKATLQALLPLLIRKTDRGFLREAQRRMADWNQLLDKVVTTARTPLRPQMVVRTLSDLLPDNAVISLDCGANTHFAGRCLQLKAGQRLTGTGMLATMGPGMPYAIAAKLAYPDRPSVAIVGDGGFAMLMAELTTAVANKLPVKIVILKNNSLAEVKFEQKEIGNPEYGCTLSPIYFRRLCEGVRGRRVPLRASRRGAHCYPGGALSPGPAIVEAVVDAAPSGLPKIGVPNTLIFGTSSQF
jgi:pyruvate dehydrogenase (quinone)